MLFFFAVHGHISFKFQPVALFSGNGLCSSQAEKSFADLDLVSHHNGILIAFDL